KARWCSTRPSTNRAGRRPPRREPDHPRSSARLSPRAAAVGALGHDHRVLAVRAGALRPRGGELPARAERDRAARRDRGLPPPWHPGGFGFVDDVHFGRDWVEKLDRLRQLAAAVGIVVGGAFAAVAIIIIGTTIRMAVLQRSREIAIMRLVGATDGFIRRPFLLQGTI